VEEPEGSGQVVAAVVAAILLVSSTSAIILTVRSSPPASAPATGHRVAREFDVDPPDLIGYTKNVAAAAPTRIGLGVTGLRAVSRRFHALVAERPVMAFAPSAQILPLRRRFHWSGRRDSNPRPQPWQGADNLGLCRNSQSAGLRLRPPSFQEIHRIIPCCRAVYSESGASLPPWRTDPERSSCTVGSRGI